MPFDTLLIVVVNCFQFCNLEAAKTVFVTPGLAPALL